MHFKITACISVPQLSKLCNIRNTTLINYWWHNGYGNGHWLIISHSLFHISVSNLQHESKLFSTAQLFLKNFFWRALQPCWASSALMETLQGNVASGSPEQSEEHWAVHTHRENCWQNIHLETYKCAKCKVSLWTQRFFVCLFVWVCHPFGNKW